MERLQQIVVLLLIFFLISCAATNPDIHLKSGDMSMEVNKSAFLLHTTAYSPDGKFILSGGESGVLMLWDVTTGKKIRQFEGHSDGIRGLGFSPDGKYALSGSLDKTIKVWDISTGRTIKTINLGEGKNRNTVFSPDAKYATTKHMFFGLKNEIKIWDLSNGSEIRRLNFGDFAFIPTAFSADSSYAIVMDADRNMTLWRIPTGEKIKTFEQGKDRIFHIAFSPDGKYTVMVGSNGKGGFAQRPIRKLIEVSSGKEIWRFTDGFNGGLGFEDTKFSPDGTYFLTARSDADLKLWDAATGAEIRRMLHEPYLNVYWRTGINFSPDGKYVANNTQSAIRIFNISTGEEIAALIGFEDGEWLAITSEGYYNSSEKGAQYLKVTFEGTDYTVDQFYDVFYRPDIVAAKLQGEDIGALVSITMKDAIKNPPPVVEFTSKLSDTNQPKVKVSYQVKNAGGGIGEVRLFHNGKLVQSDGYYREVVKSSADGQAQLAALNSKAIYAEMRSISVKGKADTTPIATKPKGDLFEGSIEIDAIPGENEVSIAAFNGSNTVQSYIKTISFNSSAKSEDPQLYILSIGIDQYKDTNVNLKYAVKDAKDIEKKLRTQSATLYKTGDIHYVLLTDGEATKTNITHKIDALSKIMKPRDSFIIFVAGHGVLLQNQYYLLTHDYNGMVNDNSMISSNEIVEMSKKIKSLSQLIIFDTCHAGGVDYIVSGLYDARMSVLAKKMGLHIYASASDKQAAMDGYKGNGLFTYALLDGLNNNKEADKNKDGKVSVVGLGEYSKKMTTNISKEIGESQTPLIINFGRDNPIYQLK